MYVLLNFLFYAENHMPPKQFIFAVYEKRASKMLINDFSTLNTSLLCGTSKFVANILTFFFADHVVVNIQVVFQSKTMYESVEALYDSFEISCSRCSSVCMCTGCTLFSIFYTVLSVSFLFCC